MKLTTNPTSRAYSYCFVEGLTVTVVIDQTTERRTVRITTDHDPTTDPRPFEIVIDGETFQATRPGVVSITTADLANRLRNQPYHDFSGPSPEDLGGDFDLVTLAAERLEELQAQLSHFVNKENKP